LGVAGVRSFYGPAVYGVPNFACNYCVLPQKQSTVLVVEDDPALQSLYRTALTLEGYLVITAEDGVGALRRIDQQRPSVIVLDLGLPRLDGRSVGREMAAHAETRDIPIIVVTADTAALNEGDFARVLRKPVDPDRLLEAIQACLRRYRAGTSNAS
jgi:DNA-binding response OmpR family regulator